MGLIIMNQGKKAMKIFVIFMLSLTLTAGYAQALPDLSSFGYRSASIPSVFDLISSPFSQIFGNSRSWDFSKPDVSSLNYVSRDEAIEIAESCFPGKLYGTPKVQKLGGVWTVTIGSYSECDDWLACPGTPGGIVKINAMTGEIISIRHYL
jgi:hypothetical protein